MSIGWPKAGYANAILHLKSITRFKYNLHTWFLFFPLIVNFKAILIRFQRHRGLLVAVLKRYQPKQESVYPI